MTHKFPNLPKGVVYNLIKQFPKQSARISNAVKGDLDKFADKNFDFNQFMNKLFWSKDILRRTGYYHFKTLLQINKIQ